MSDTRKIPSKYLFTPENTPGADDLAIGAYNHELIGVLADLEYGSPACDARVKAFHAEVRKRDQGEHPTLR